MAMSATMGMSLKDFPKSASLIACTRHTKANGNDIRVLRNPSHPNFRGSNNNKKKRQSWNRSIRCHGYTANDKRMLQGLMHRRQLLLASTSLPFKPQQMMMAAMPPPPDLTDYHKLANVVHETQKFKNSPHGRPEINDAVCWFSSSQPLKPSSSSYKSPDDLSGIVAVPRAQELLREIHENEVIITRVRRPVAFKLMKHQEEELVLEGIEVTNDKPLCFDVYIKLGQEDDEEELYAGTFSHIPPRRKKRHNIEAASDVRHEQRRVRRCCLRLGMNGMLIHRPLNSHQVESVIVKLVPTIKLEDDPIKVASIFIEYT